MVKKSNTRLKVTISKETDSLLDSIVEESRGKGIMINKSFLINEALNVYFAYCKAKAEQNEEAQEPINKEVN